MRRLSVAAACALALALLIIPAVSEAEELPFPYYGGLSGIPLIPCSGFNEIPFQQSNGTVGSGAVVSPGTIGTVNGSRLPMCTSICDVFVLFNRLLALMMSVMVTILFPVFVFVGGIMLFISGGNPAKRTQAKQMIQGAVVGLAIALCAVLIVNELLFVIFNKAWGEAIKEKIRGQADLGFTEQEAAGLFDWDNMACSVNYKGVNFSPYTTPTTPGTTPTR